MFIHLVSKQIWSPSSETLCLYSKAAYSTMQLRVCSGTKVDRRPAERPDNFFKHIVKHSEIKHIFFCFWLNRKILTISLSGFNIRIGWVHNTWEILNAHSSWSKMTVLKKGSNICQLTLRIYRWSHAILYQLIHNNA